MRLLQNYENPQRMIRDQNHSSVADQPQVVTESSGNVMINIALTSSSAPCQPANITFPKRPYCDKVSRSFNNLWYHQYSWLEYILPKREHSLLLSMSFVWGG